MITKCPICQAENYADENTVFYTCCSCSTQNYVPQTLSIPCGTPLTDKISPFTRLECPYCKAHIGLDYAPPQGLVGCHDCLKIFAVSSEIKKITPVLQDIMLKPAPVPAAPVSAVQADSVNFDNAAIPAPAPAPAAPARAPVSAISPLVLPPAPANSSKTGVIVASIVTVTILLGIIGGGGAYLYLRPTARQRCKQELIKAQRFVKNIFADKSKTDSTENTAQNQNSGVQQQ